MSSWTLFSNHGHVLICLSRDSEARLRDVAADVGITERAVQKIVRDLQDGGMISISKNGRRNSYRIHNRKLLRHDLESHCGVGDLISVVNRKPKPMGIQALAPSRKPVARTFNPVRLETERSESKKPGPRKSSASDSKERQQGSLF